MARMIPVEPDSDSPDSERYVFRRLEERLPDSWLVFHARRFTIPRARGRRPIEGEVDFIVLDPQRGFVTLEVKGGSIRYRDGLWTREQDGSEVPIKDPGKQAQHAAFRISDHLKGIAKLARRSEAIRFGSAVVFPDVDVRGGFGPDLPRSLIIDRGDFGRLLESVQRVFDFYEMRGPELDAAQVSAFREALAPTLHLVKPLAANLEEQKDALVRLTGEQAGILDVLDEMPRVAIQGAAGTGKTLLAAEKARRLAAEGKNVLLLCFNRPLADHLAAGADGYDVQNFHGLCNDLAHEASVPFDVPEGSRAQRAFWEDEAPLILIDSLEACPQRRWDAIVVDEGQDFREGWWPALEEALRSPQKGTLVVFFDPNQDIYGGGPPAGLGVAPARLRWNCRNTGNIARYSAGLIDVVAEIKPGSPEGESVLELNASSEAETAELVGDLLNRLINEARIDPGQIVVLSTRNPSRSSLAKHRELGSVTLVPPDAPVGPKQVRFDSLHRFKGLESDVVVLIDVGSDRFTSSPKHLYVGASRARLVLVVVRTAES